MVRRTPWTLTRLDRATRAVDQGLGTARGMLVARPMSECYDWTDEPEAEQRRVFSQLRRLDDGRWTAVFEPALEAVADTPRAALTQALRTLGDRACGLERGLAELDRLEQEWRRSPLRSLRGGQPRSEVDAA